MGFPIPQIKNLYERKDTSRLISKENNPPKPQLKYTIHSLGVL